MEGHCRSAWFPCAMIHPHEVKGRGLHDNALRCDPTEQAWIPCFVDGVRADVMPPLMVTDAGATSFFFLME